MKRSGFFFPSLIGWPRLLHESLSNYLLEVNPVPIPVVAVVENSLPQLFEYTYRYKQAHCIVGENRLLDGPVCSQKSIGQANIFSSVSKSLFSQQTFNADLRGFCAE